MIRKVTKRRLLFFSKKITYFSFLTLQDIIFLKMSKKIVWQKTKKNYKKIKFFNFSKNDHKLFWGFLGFSLKINKNEFFKVIIEKTSIFDKKYDHFKVHFFKFTLIIKIILLSICLFFEKYILII